MTVSGKTVYKKIESRIKKVEKEHKDYADQLYGYESKIENLVVERENTYTTLAKNYLPVLDAESVENTLREVQRDVQTVFRTKQERRRKVEDRMYDLTEKRDTEQEKLITTTEKLDEKAQERDRLIGEITDILNQDQKYVLLESSIQELANTLRINHKRYDEFQTEAEAKLQVYENNRLFGYLIDRGHTKKRKGLIGRLDRWIADIIDYEDAKENYDFLKAMPNLMLEEIQARENKLEKLEKKLGRIEKKASDEYGLTKVLEQGDKIGKQRDNLMEKIGKINTEYDDLSNERKELDSTKGDYHEKAIQHLKKYLKGEDIIYLKSLARETPGSEDDRLVNRIEEIDLEIRQYKDSAKEARDKRDNTSKKLNGFKKIINEYESNDYESSRSYFDTGFDVDNLLLLYLAGQRSRSNIFNEMENHQHFKPKPRRSSYSSSRSSSSYSSSSSFGGGGFSSGGGFGGGGGFSSGTGF